MITLVCLTKRMLRAFSLRINLLNIFDQDVGSDTIPALHGLKSLSMAWVILGHTCILAFKYSGITKLPMPSDWQIDVGVQKVSSLVVLDNMEYRKVVQREFLFQTITNGTFSVDTFFFTSGLLVAFLYFRQNAKGKLDAPFLKQVGKFGSAGFHFIGLIMYRFARLVKKSSYIGTNPSRGKYGISVRSWLSAFSGWLPPICSFWA